MSPPACQVQHPPQQHIQQDMNNMANMGYNHMNPHHSTMPNYTNVHSNQSCPPGSVEAVDQSGQGNLESPNSIGSGSNGSAENHLSHSRGPASVESYHHQQQQYHHQQAAVYDARHSMPQSPMMINCGTPQPQVQHANKPSAQHQQSKFNLTLMTSSNFL